jgi:DNA-binding MarR family transcriptional regulator
MKYHGQMPMSPTTPNVWLDERETRAWRGFHRMRSALLAHLARELAVSCNLTQAEFEILVVVSEAPGRRIRARDLSTALHWERSRLSHQIARMETRGTITRAACDNDARGFDVVLTPAGLRAIDTAAPLNLEAVRHCFIDVLTDEQLDTLGDIAEAITTHLEREHPCS